MSGNNVTELRNSNQKKEEKTNLCKNNLKWILYIEKKVLKSFKIYLDLHILLIHFYMNPTLSIIKITSFNKKLKTLKKSFAREIIFTVHSFKLLLSIQCLFNR